MLGRNSVTLHVTHSSGSNALSAMTIIHFLALIASLRWRWQARSSQIATLLPCLLILHHPAQALAHLLYSKHSFENLFLHNVHSPPASFLVFFSLSVFVQTCATQVFAVGHRSLLCWLQHSKILSQKMCGKTRLGNDDARHPKKK